MTLDPYTLCPGGREKKIKFCCSDMIKEIEQIERLLESNQGGACITYIENLEKDHKDCACLTAAKLSVFRSENRWAEALPLAKTFLEKEPENPVAASEYALALSVTGDSKSAISTLIDAFERAKEGTAHSAIINATLQVGTHLLMQGLVMPAVAIGNQLKHFPTAEEPANSLLYRASSFSEIPLLLRDMIFEHVCPDDFPGKDVFEDAVELVRLMRWKSALAKLESLTQYAGLWGTIWRDIASIRIWLLDFDGGNEALKTYAALPNAPLEDAADAEATRLFLSADAVGDQIGLLTIEYPITDAEKALEKILSTPVFYQAQTDLRRFAQENTVPPKGTFVLLDRPYAAPGTEITFDNVSSQIAVCHLFGKETDREARLVLTDCIEYDRTRVEAKLKETLGDLMQEPSHVDGSRKISKTHVLVQYRFRFTPEILPPNDRMQQLENEYYEKSFAEAWNNLPLGLLDGKTPAEAAKEPAYKIRLLAVILMIESWMNEETGITVANKLRSRLGLPTHDPIPVPEGSEEDLLGVLDDHPVWRWYRFDTAKLPTNLLAEGLQIVNVMKEPRATLRFAKELLNRPMDSVPIPLRFLAFESLIGIAKGLGAMEEALLWIEKAKNESAANNVPDAGWCLHEIPILLMQGQLENAQNRIQYVIRKYSKDQRVMQALQQLFVELGMLNPDGTPAAMMQQEAAAAPASTPGIWTPDASGAAGANSSGSKLWTPD
jgi:hypothetical protein